MSTAILLIAAALAGSVTAAEAQSRRTDDRYNEAPPYDRWARPPTYRSFALTGDVSTRRPRKLVDVRDQSIDRISVQSTGGLILVRRISVEYGNRNIVDYELHARLAPGEVRTIDVRGRRIHRVEVFVDPRWRGTYQLRATPGYRRPGPPIG